MFVKQGVAWGAEFADVRGLVFARTRKVAEQYVAWMQEHQGINLVIADIQAVARKSFEAVIMECYRDGASRYLVIQWVGREEVQLGIAPLDSILHEVDGWTVPLADTELPKYMVTYDDDRLMIYEDGNKRGPILAYTREVAERYAAETERRDGIKLAILDSPPMLSPATTESAIRVGGSNPSGRTSGKAADLPDATCCTGNQLRPQVATGQSLGADESTRFVGPFFLPFRCKSMQSVPVRGGFVGTNTGTMGTYTGTV